MLALNQKQTELALSLTSEAAYYTADLNIKLLLMTELNDWNGVCDLLFKIKTNGQRSDGKRYRVSTQVVSAQQNQYQSFALR